MEEPDESTDWEKLSPLALRGLLRNLDVPWWIAGGWAIDLFLGRETRDHRDIDVALLRRDQARLVTRLPGWEFRYATTRHVLVPWHGEQLAPPIHGIWARRSATSAGPWTCEFVLNEATRWEWVYWRHDAVRRPLSEIGGERDGVPYLRPEIVLLFKSTDLTATNEADFAAALPALDTAARRWLARSLDACRPGHPWRRELDS
jgi:Aminoglycoside-2''-adenylyltransferase